jgi:DNA-binding GntR family transcriptional regulator
MPARSTVTDDTTEAVRAILLSGEFTPGQPLRQVELAERLGVSRTPLREALHRLSAEGLVRLDPHRGAVVAQPSVTELLELYEIREAVEVLAVRQAAMRCTKQEVEDLSFDLEAMGYITDASAWGRANLRFHQRVFALSRKVQLCDLIGQLGQRSELYVRMLVSSEQQARRANHEHEELVQALREQNADQAEAITRHHLRATVSRVAALLSADGDPSH